MLFGSGARMEKSSGKYSLFSNLHYHYKNLWKWEPLVFWIGILVLIPWTLSSLIGYIIVQQGKHEELVSVDGLYGHMWNAQAQYYNED